MKMGNVRFGLFITFEVKFYWVLKNIFLLFYSYLHVLIFYYYFFDFSATC